MAGQARYERNQPLLSIPFQPVLLAMKKRGFGAGKWNGPGGKAHPGETPTDALIREVREEIGVTVLSANDRGLIEFVYASKPEWSQRCRIFSSADFDGEPTESEEMKPQWFSTDGIPYHEMWESDGIWFPQLLAGARVGYRIYFNDEMRLMKHEPIAL